MEPSLGQLQQDRVRWFLRGQIHILVRLYQVSVTDNVAKAAVGIPIYKHAALLIACFSAQGFKVQQFVDGIGNILCNGDEAVVCIEPAQLGVVQCLGYHMAAVRTVGKVDELRDENIAVPFFNLHFQKPRKGGLLYRVQISQLSGEGVQLIDVQSIADKRRQVVVAIVVADIKAQLVRC